MTSDQDRSNKTAPVQGYEPGIPWEMHLRAYDAYCKRWGPQQALIQGGCRGGFGDTELDTLIPGWREELSDRKKDHDEFAWLRIQLSERDKIINQLQDRCLELKTILGDAVERRDKEIEGLRTALEIYQHHPDSAP